MVGLTSNGQEYLHVDALTRPSLKGKLKSDENGHVLQAVLDTLSSFVNIFL